MRLWRGEATELIHNSYALLDERGLAKTYVDVPGLCKTANLGEIEAQGEPQSGALCRRDGAGGGRGGFSGKLEELQEEFERLTGEARALEDVIASQIVEFI